MVDDRVIFESNPDSVSSSKIELWSKGCKKAYRYEHVLKVPQGPKGLAARVGVVVHGVARRLGRRCVPVATEAGITPTLGQAWQALGEEPDAADPLVAARAQEILDSFVPTLRYFPSTLLEIEWRLPLRNGWEVRGIFDRVDPLASGEVVVGDYKTGSSPPGSLENDTQALLYLAGAKHAAEAVWPGAPVSFYQDWVTQGFRTPLLSWTPDLDVRARAIAEAAITARKEEEALEARLPEKAWAATIKLDVCAACPHALRCSELRGFLSEAQLADEAGGLDVNAATRRARQLAGLEKVAKKVREPLTAALRGVLETEGDFEVDGVPVKLRAGRGWRQFPREPERAMRWLESAGIECDREAVRSAITKLDGKALEKVLKGIPDKALRKQALERLDDLAPKRLRRSVWLGSAPGEEEEDDEEGVAT